MSAATSLGDRQRPLSIVSLIPSATEIVGALGLLDYLTGRSHECDFPPSVQSRPVCTQPKFNPEGNSAEVHQRVTNLLQSALSVYQVDAELLQSLQPTHIITQAQCEVCAVSLADVERAVAELVWSHPKIISLQPQTLSDVWADIQRVASALGVNGDPLITMLKHRVSDCVQQSQHVSMGDRPKVACIEWIDPPMAAGNWIPELVELAGGRPCFGVPGQHSSWITWSEVAEADPDLIVVMPCGYDLSKTRSEMHHLIRHAEWRSLRAVKSGCVYITDGNQYFNRPGPRLVDSLELLAEVIHPRQFEFGYQGYGWERFYTSSLR